MMTVEQGDPRGIYAEVMAVPYEGAASPFAEDGVLGFEFARVWTRPGLGRRERRLVTLTCVGAGDTVGPIDAHVYAALKSGDLTLAELQEFVLHFAVYCGWPKASLLDQTVSVQNARISGERGDAPSPPAPLEPWNAGEDSEQRLARGEACFREINFVPAPPRTSPYTLAGILNFVFGEVWQRPGLSERDRRCITVAAVGVDDTIIPIRSHVYSALKSGQLSRTEMEELVLHFAVYAGWSKAAFLDEVVHESWARVQDEGGPVTPADNDRT
ncbi:MAG TPA: carboxymuconolactone decarboxylase family protein [Acidimicrobiales bacterium]|nr:carboxymuconolactone decarboxylase family protein [Acidimicrobiales bacterium]